MKYHRIGTSPRDAEAARREAKRDGQTDGNKNFPTVDPSGKTKASDNYSDGLRDESITTDTLTKAGHFATQRIDDDKALGLARATTAQCTARTADARADVEDALAEDRAYKQKLPLSAKFGFWNRWLVWALLVALAGASGAAVTAALLSVTTDSETLSYVIGVGVALATVAGGASLGSLLRRRDLDFIKEGAYASHGIYSGAVLAIGLIGLIAIAIGVAGLRDAASEADSARRAQQNQIQVFIPGQETAQPRPHESESESHGVGWPIWLAFEVGLAAAAVALEFQRADARAEHGETLAKAVNKTHTVWTSEHACLKDAVATHEVALLTREDHDFAVILTGDGQRSFARRLAHDYRHSNLSQRGQGGDPFDQLEAADSSELEHVFSNFPGVDVVTLSTHEPIDPDSAAPFLEKLRDDQLLAAAYAGLTEAPARPQRADGEQWVPGEYLGLDGAAQALQDRLRADEGEPSTTEPTDGGEEPAATRFWDEYPEAEPVSGNGSQR